MKILEFMSFDPSWFLTPSGLLITGGVVLLLIALIVFIASSKKDKGNANVDPTVEGSIPLVEGPTGDVNQMNQGVTTSNMVDPMMNQSMNNVPDMNGMANPMPQMVPGMDMNQSSAVMPTIPEVNPASVQVPNVNVVPVVDPMVNMAAPIDQTNVVASVAPTMPVNNQEVIPVISENQNVAPVIDFGSVQPQPVINPEPVIPTPVVEPQVQEQPQVMNNNIYGGNNPAQINNRPIYGGANPLENTSSIPTISSHTAYNGEPIIPNSVVEEVKIMDPTPINQVNQPAVMNNQTTPISANDIFGQAPVMSSVEIQQPTPVVEQQVPVQPQVMPAPTIAEPTPVNSVNQNNTIETLDF